MGDIELTEPQARSLQQKLYDHTDCRNTKMVVEEGNEVWALIDLLNEKLDDRPADVSGEYNHLSNSNLYDWVEDSDE